MLDNRFRLSALPSSNNGVLSIKPDEALQKAISVMIINEYSQLPVMTTDRDVKGIISWKSIGTALQLSNRPPVVKEYMDTNCTILKLDANFLTAVKTIIEEEFVLIRDRTEKICGVCTLADIGSRFLAHSKPFIEIEQIEMAIRELINDKLTASDPSNGEKAPDDSPVIRDASDLTFGEYVCWFENKENWENLDLAIDRKVFLENLKIVNEIRNRLMHFRPDGMSDDDLMRLKDISKFFRVFQKFRQT